MTIGRIAVILMTTLLSAVTVTAAEPERPLRVVSLAPSLTETVFQLGRGDWLVGRTAVCKYPAEALKIPVIGDYSIPSLEKLASAKPDIIIADNLKDPSMRDTFAALNIKFYLLPSKRIQDYTENVRKLGEILNCREAANAEIKRIENGLNDFTRRHPQNNERQTRRVLLMIWDNPLVTCGRDSFLNDYLRYAGGVNIAEKEDKAYFKCSLEWAIAANPEVIIFPGQPNSHLKTMLQTNGWSATDAAKHRRIYGKVDADSLFILGPKILDGITTLEQLIGAESNADLR